MTYKNLYEILHEENLMSNHISATKRYKQSEKKRVRNRKARSILNTEIKKLTLAGINHDTVYIGQRALAIAARKKILHKKTASRRISRLMSKAKFN